MTNNDLNLIKCMLAITELQNTYRLLSQQSINIDVTLYVPSDGWTTLSTAPEHTAHSLTGQSQDLLQFSLRLRRVCAGAGDDW